MTICFAGAVLLGGCGGRPSRAADASGLPTGRAITRADLVRLPASRLRYPGSKVLELVGGDQTPNGDPEDPDPAYVGAVLTAKATPEQLYAWYRSVLERRGFAPATDLRPADETSGQAWHFHHRLQLQVGVLDPALLRTDRDITAPSVKGEIVYQAVLVGYMPGLPKY